MTKIVEEETKFGTALNPIEIKSNANCLTRERVDETKPEPKFKSGNIVKCSDNSVGVILDCEWSESTKSYQYFIDYIGTLDMGYQFEKDLQLHSVTTMNGRDIFENAKWKHEIECPKGYIFKDENGNVINATKIVLEKKKKEYPKTYEECYKIMGVKLSDCYIQGYKSPLLEDLQELLICRDAYWKIAGEEMGLGKSWEPDWNHNTKKYVIYPYQYLYSIDIENYRNTILAFPTEEMRDTFYENFKELIEQCKELL